MSIFNVFTLMGGIAMFLYGMDLMGKALEQTAGSKLQGILSKMTASPVRGLLLGMVVTAVIQSSGATTVMAVGFVNSGLMELHMRANAASMTSSWAPTSVPPLPAGCSRFQAWRVIPSPSRC